MSQQDNKNTFFVVDKQNENSHLLHLVSDSELGGNSSFTHLFSVFVFFLVQYEMESSTWHLSGYLDEWKFQRMMHKCGLYRYVGLG